MKHAHLPQRILPFLFSVLLMLLVLILPAAAFPETARKDVYRNTDYNDYSIAYTLFLPENYDASETYPMLLFLHGAGERGADNELQLRNAVRNLYDTRPELLGGSFVLCPQCPENEQWVDWPWTDGNYSVDAVPESKSLSTAVKLMKSIADSYSADPHRIYIFGLSMGGYGTWDALVRHESVFAAGAALCGGGDASKAELLKEIPIWAVHGTADGAVRYAGTEGMVSAIKAAGGERIRFTSLDGYGHNVWDYASTNGELIDWLYAQDLRLRYPDPEPETEPETEPVSMPETAAMPETESADVSETEPADVSALWDASRFSVVQEGAAAEDMRSTPAYTAAASAAVSGRNVPVLPIAGCIVIAAAVCAVIVFLCRKKA